MCLILRYFIFTIINMNKKYSHSKKKKLVNKINKLKNKEHYVQVLKIIKKREDVPTKETGNSTFMFFHNLQNETYCELEKYVKSILKKNKKTKSNDNDTITSSSVQEYKPYSNDKYTINKNMNPKLKYSNKEKNILKKTHYDINLMEENGSDIVYTQFNVDNLTDTDKKN